MSYKIFPLLALALAASFAPAPARSQGDVWAYKEAYDRCMQFKPANANQCYDYTCFYQGCIAQHSQAMTSGGFTIADPAGAQAAVAQCQPHIQAQINCIREHGVLTQPVAPPPPPPGQGGTFSCAAKDNEEDGCCCFRGAHTYLFEPTRVGSASVTFDTGRGPNCESLVRVRVRTAPETWEVVGDFSVKSGNGTAEIYPHTESVSVGKVITGVMVSDGCVCCIDDSSVSLD